MLADFQEVPFSAFTRKLLTFSGLLGRHIDRFEDLYTSRTGDITYFGAAIDDAAYKKTVFFVSRAVLDHAMLGNALLTQLRTLNVVQLTESRHQIKVPFWDVTQCAKTYDESRTSQPLVERTSFADLLLMTLRHKRSGLQQSQLINLIAKSSYQIQTVIEARLQQEYGSLYNGYPELLPRRERKRNAALLKGTVP